MLEIIISNTFYTLANIVRETHAQFYKTVESISVYNMF